MNEFKAGQRVKVDFDPDTYTGGLLGTGANYGKCGTVQEVDNTDQTAFVLIDDDPAPWWFEQRHLKILDDGTQEGAKTTEPEK